MPNKDRRVTAPQHKAVKVAIDLPGPLFLETERATQELSVNRSALIRAALEMFLREKHREKLEREIAASFSANRDLDGQLIDEFKHVDADIAGPRKRHDKA